MDVDMAGAGSEHPARFKVWLATLVGVAAIAAATLAWLEAWAGAAEESAMATATHRALDVFVGLGASGPAFQFEANAQRQALLLEAQARARASATTLDALPLQVALAESMAENDAARELLELSGRLADLPSDVEGLDTATSESLRIRSEEDVAPVYAAQQRALADAERAGSRQQRAMYGLSLTAVAASLLGLAGLLGASRGGWTTLGTASVALAVGAGAALSGLLL